MYFSWNKNFLVNERKKRMKFFISAIFQIQLLLNIISGVYFIIMFVLWFLYRDIKENWCIILIFFYLKAPKNVKKTGRLCNHVESCLSYQKYSKLSVVVTSIIQWYEITSERKWHLYALGDNMGILSFVQITPRKKSGMLSLYAKGISNSAISERISDL